MSAREEIAAVEAAAKAYHDDFPRQSALGRAAINHVEAMERAIDAARPLLTAENHAGCVPVAAWVDEVDELTGERDAARAALAVLTEQRDAVLAIHKERKSQVAATPSWCADCGALWPCATARALGVDA